MTLKRHLIYHLYPRASASVWKWNVDILLKHLDCFNGQRTIAIVSDETTEDIDSVKAYFPKDVEFLTFPNIPKLGEVVSFPALLRSVCDDRDPNSITFYAHSKGISHSPAERVYWHWTQIMYSALLDYLPLVDDWLSQVSMVGALLYGVGPLAGIHIPWHFPGTFFWFRNADIFASPHWQTVHQRWCGTEAWPGIVIPDVSRARGIVTHEPNRSRRQFCRDRARHHLSIMYRRFMALHHGKRNQPPSITTPKRTLIYTTLFGDMRVAYPLHESDRQNADCICFSDREASSLDAHGWTVKTLHPWAPPLAMVKILKCMPQMLGDYERSIYIDAAVQPKLPLLPLLDSMNGCDMLCFQHPDRRTAGEEYRFCYKIRKDAPERLDATAAILNGTSYPLFLGGLLWRKHTPAVEEFGKRWLFHTFTGTSRDQISMPVAIAQSGLTFKAMDKRTLGNLVTLNKRKR